MVILQEVEQLIAGGCQVSYPQAGHGISLGETVDLNHVVLGIGKGKETFMPHPIEDQVFVDLIGDQGDVVLYGQLQDGVQGFFRVDASGGIVGGQHDEDLALGSDDLLDLSWVGNKTFFALQLDEYGFGPGQMGITQIRGVMGEKDNNFVSRIGQSHDGNMQGCLASRRH